jgi:hypothetical protein
LSDTSGTCVLVDTTMDLPKCGKSGSVCERFGSKALALVGNPDLRTTVSFATQIVTELGSTKIGSDLFDHCLRLEPLRLLILELFSA